MEKKYIKSKKTLSFIRYNIVFCSRCNRKIFRNEKVKELFKIECKRVCDYLDVEIVKLETFEYYVLLIIDSGPKYSANSIVQKIKMHTSKIIRETVIELSRIPSLWTRDFLVSTEENLDKELLTDFLMMQEK